MKTVSLALVLAAGVFVTGAVAQHDEHEHGAVTPQSNVMGNGMMMSHMHEMMMGGHNDVSKLVDELQQNVTAMQGEKKPGAVKEKIAAQAALIKELQAKVAAQSNMMEMMMKDMPMKDMPMKDMDSCKNMPAK